ncbi:hypothetical protein [Haloarchaeobius sp. FL176]|uniref:hypothetical protein n=1 Tax=Haloarchaeobius sp. FL176 TaxID=2967129 RepID=UPI002148AE64|nr:hypothetical protein [Haloarchaeobius sp. FL176]
MSHRYNLKNLKKVMGKPEYILWEAQRILFNLRYEGGIDVMEQDWDNLLLLDACRYDYFEERCEFEGDLQSVISRGGRSWEFMEGNFVGKTFHDTIYVTANPHTGKLADDVFHAVEPLYLEEWDDKNETVLPETVVEEALAAHQRFPDKRLIVHFMQPHRPYLGPTGEELRAKYDVRGFNRHVANEERSHDSRESFSKMVERGKIPAEKAQKAYSETLDIVLEHVAELLDGIDGKTVISSDHGELLGERMNFLTNPKFGHSHDAIRNRTLYEVPWLEIEGDRRHITEDEPVDTESGSDENLEDRLRALGYK